MGAWVWAALVCMTLAQFKHIKKHATFSLNPSGASRAAAHISHHTMPSDERADLHGRVDYSEVPKSGVHTVCT